MIEYGDYLLFDYRDMYLDGEDDTLICRYISSDDTYSYLQIFYCGEWWTIFDIGDIRKFNDLNLEHAYHYKTYAELVAMII